MKKIISLGIASAVLALTAISASAAVVVKTDADPVRTGATIVVEYSVDADGTGIQFNIAPTGMTLVSSEVVGGAGDMNKVNDAGTFYINVGAVKAGVPFLKQTYTVTAKEGEAAAVNVSGVVGSDGTPVNLTVASVAAAESGNNSGDNSGTSDTSSDPASKPGDEKDPPPDTGVALAVFPAIIAGAAVVVAKKRK